MIFLRCLIIFFLLLGIVTAKDYTIKTDYDVYIDYPEELVKYAKYTAYIVNKSYPEYQKLFGINLKNVRIILLDTYDFVSDNMFPSSFDNIRIYIIAPVTNNFILEDSHYLENNIRRQLIYAFHQGQNTSIQGVFSKIFGEEMYFYPNLFLPRWQKNGIVNRFMYNDDTPTVQYANGIMRAEYQNNFKTLFDASFGAQYYKLDTLYSLDLYSIYGYFYYDYILKKYGLSKTLDYINNGTNRLFSDINKTAEETFSESIDELWSEFIIYEKLLIEKQIADLEKNEITSGLILADRSISTTPILEDEDGNIIYYSEDPKESSVFKKTKIKDGQEYTENLFKMQNVKDFDYNSKDGFVISRLEYCGAFLNKGFATVYVENDSGSHRISPCEHYVLVRWLNDGSGRILGVRYIDGTPEINIIDLKGKLVENIYKGNIRELIYDVSVSSSGKKLLINILPINKTNQFLEYDFAKKEYKYLTNDDNVKITPKYVDNDNSVVFVSNYDGFYNVRKLNLLNNKFETLTNVLSVSSSPNILKNGTLVYRNAIADGEYNISYLEQPKALDTYAPPPDTSINSSLIYDDISKMEFETSNYNVLRNFFPRSWYPLSSGFTDPDYINFGFSTRSVDPSFTNFYELTLLYYYGFQDNLSGLGGSFFYNYNGVISFNATRTMQKTLTDPSSGMVLQDSAIMYSNVNYLIPLVSRANRFLFLTTSLGVEAEERFGVNGYDGDGFNSSEFVGAFLYYDDTYKSNKNPLLPVNGRSVLLISKFYLDSSDKSGLIAYKEYFAYKNVNFAVSLAYGNTNSVNNKYELGGVIQSSVNLGENSIPNPPSIYKGFQMGEENMYSKQISMPGYTTGLPQLTAGEFSMAKATISLPILEKSGETFPVPIAYESGRLTFYAVAAQTSNTNAYLYDYEGVQNVYSSQGVEFTLYIRPFYGSPSPLTLGLVVNNADFPNYSRANSQLYFVFSTNF